MNDTVRNNLRELLSDHGVEVCDDRVQCKDLLDRELSEYPQELKALTAVIDAGIVDELRTRSSSLSLPELAERIELNGLDRESALWAIESWAQVIEDAERADGEEDRGVIELGQNLGVRARLTASLAGAVFGGMHGASLWLFGLVVSWGLKTPGQAALIGAVVGLIRGLRDFAAIVPLHIICWTVGAGTGVLLLQWLNAPVVWPLSGVVAWAISVALTRALKRTLGGNSPQDFLRFAPLVALAGGILGWPIGSIIAGTIHNALELPWSWCVVGGVSGVIVAASSSLHLRFKAALVQVILAATYGAGLGLIAGALSGPDGGVVGWIVGGALMALAPSAFMLPVERHQATIRCVRFSSDGKFAVSASADSTIGLWDVEQATLIGFFREHTNGANCIAISPSGKFAVTGGGDQLLFLLNGETGAVEREFVGHTDAILSVVYTPNGHNLLSGSADRTVRLWDAETGNEQLCLAAHTASVTSVAVADNDMALTGSSDGTARLWNLATSQEIAQFPSVRGPVYAVAFTQDGAHAVVSDDAGIRQWDIATCSPTRVLEGHQGPVYDLAVSPVDNRLLSSGRDGTVRLWDLQTGQAMEVFHSSKRPIRTVAFSPDGLTALSSGDDRVIRMMRLPA